MANLAERREPNDPKSLLRRIARLEEGLKFLRSSRDLVGRATVDAGKELLIRGGLKVAGAVSMVSEDGTELFRIGDMLFGRGVEMKRDDGSTAFKLAKPFSETDPQQLIIFDRYGNQIIAESSIGPGLSKPQLEHPFQPVAATSGTAVTCGPFGWERTTSSGTFETLFAYDGKTQNLLLDLKLAAVCSNGTTAGEIQVVDLDTGVPLPGYFAAPWLGTIPTGTTTLTLIDPAPNQVLLPVFDTGIGDNMRLGIQVRRTAGTGTITLAVPQSIGG